MTTVSTSVSAKTVSLKDWGASAAAELEAARIETPQLRGKSSKLKSPVVEPMQVIPVTAATIRAEAEPVRSVIERSSLRFTFLFEPYQPNGVGRFGSGEEVNYSNLPGSVLGQLDLRWLPLEVGHVFAMPASIGGYAAIGYARQALPLVAPSGFRYDDVVLNTFRYEAGAAVGLALSSTANLEFRMGAGRLTAVQTSRFSDLVGTFERPYLIAALDLSYYLARRFALVGSVAKRTPFADGNGSIAFEPMTVSGGFLVQIR